MERLINLANRLFRDKDGQVVIWQWPNLPLSAWLLSIALDWFIRGSAKTIISLIGALALLVWAVLEIVRGESLFRRVIGTVIVVGMLAGLLVRAIH